MKGLISKVQDMDIEGRRGIIAVLSVLSTVWQTRSDIAFDAYGSSNKDHNAQVEADIRILRQHVGIESKVARGRGSGMVYRIGSIEELQRVRELVPILKGKAKYEQAGRDNDSSVFNSEFVRGDSQASESRQEQASGKKECAKPAAKGSDYAAAVDEVRKGLR